MHVHDVSFDSYSLPDPETNINTILFCTKHRSCCIGTGKQVWLSCGLHSWKLNIIRCICSEYVQHIGEYADVNVRYSRWFWLWFNLFTSGCCCRLLLRNETFTGYRNCSMWFRYVLFARNRNSVRNGIIEFATFHFQHIGFGTFAFAPLATWLLQNFDWKNANLILAGLILNCAIFGALMRPLT